MYNPSPEVDHFGLITFNNLANLEFNFNQFLTKEAVLKEIAEEPLELDQETRTDLVLIMAKDQLFNPAGGDRPDKPDILFIFTDGKPTHPQRNFNFTAFAEEIAKDFKASISSTVQCGPVRSSAVQCGPVRSSAVQCGPVLCCAVLCCAVLCCAVLCCAVLCCVVLCCAVHVLCVQLCVVLPCAVQSSASLCYAVQCFSVLCYAISSFYPSSLLCESASQHFYFLSYIYSLQYSFCPF